jgi:hypothetical protein
MNITNASFWKIYLLKNIFLIYVGGEQNKIACLYRCHLHIHFIVLYMLAQISESYWFLNPLRVFESLIKPVCARHMQKTNYGMDIRCQIRARPLGSVFYLFIFLDRVVQHDMVFDSRMTLISVWRLFKKLWLKWNIAKLVDQHTLDHLFRMRSPLIYRIEKHGNKKI